MPAKMICKNCRFVGEPEPDEQRCPKCRAPYMVPLDTPAGNEMMSAAPVLPAPLPPLPKEPSKPESSWGCLAVLVGIGLLVVLAVSDRSEDSSHTESSLPPARESAESPPDTAAAAAAKTRVMGGVLKGVITAMDINSMPPSITVGPAFYDLSFARKEAFVRDVNAMFVGGRPLVIPIKITDWQTGKEVATWGVGGFKMK